MHHQINKPVSTPAADVYFGPSPPSPTAQSGMRLKLTDLLYLRPAGMFWLSDSLTVFDSVDISERWGGAGWRVERGDYS